MRITLLKILDQISIFIDKLKSEIKNQNVSAEDTSYFQLSPIRNLKEDNHYITALNWAIKNRRERDIKNIALTGPYGAGKSSILKAFQENCTDKDLHFLDISLATFKEEKQKKDKNGNDKLRQIEISILQQIFYHEEDGKIPDSRFKKIRISSKKELAVKAAALITAFLSLFWLFSDIIPLEKFPHYNSSFIFFERISLLIILGFCSYISFSFLKQSRKSISLLVPVTLICINIAVLLFYGFKYVFNIQDYLFEVNLIASFSKVLSTLSITYLLLFLFFAVKELIAFLDKVSVNKLKINDTEIEIGSTHQKSVMNQHLDEILYFFSVRPYNVVIIEDLDRFKQTEIFTKLREINLLLNQSEKTKSKNIVFIYAVRDEMFQDKDRTKFFDFIIPIIPTINSSNSSQILLLKNSDNHYELSESFIENISFVIDDMRLLHNICNEFYLYKNLLSPQLNPEKLFSIITYKNILPNDFVLLSNNTGILHELLNSKKVFVSQINSEIDNEIDTISAELKSLESNYYKNIEDLRKIYILRMVEKLPKFQSFSMNGKQLSFNDVAKTEHFNSLMSDTLSYNTFYVNNSYRIAQMETPMTVKFSEVDKEINAAKGYSKTEKEIEDLKKDIINVKKLKVKELENLKTSNRTRRLTSILEDSRFKLDNLFTPKVNETVEKDLEIKQNEKNNFLLTFLRNGYIAEDYIEYISIFHEGSISREDHSFYINLQNRAPQEFSYKLTRTENLINKISATDFKTEYVFNFSILDFLLSNQIKYKLKLDNLIEKITDESEKSISFVTSCYENLENIPEFTKLITSKWDSFWTVLSNDKTTDSALQENIFLSAVTYSEIESLKKISAGNGFSKKIYLNPLFLNIIPDQERIKDILKNLYIDFDMLDLKNTSKELNDYVNENWRYELNIPNLKEIMEYYGTFNAADFEKSNYKALQESKCADLISYVNDYMGDYITNVYLELNANNEEEENYYLQLLDNENISEEQRELIIQKVNTIISKATLIKNKPLQLKLLSANKIKPTWDNVFYFMEEEENFEAVTNYLNNAENSSALGAVKVSLAKDKDGKYKYGDQYKNILHLENITIENYASIADSNRWWYDSLDIETIAEEKIRILISKNIVKPNKKLFSQIQQHHKNILPALIEKNTDKILSILSEIEIDQTDLEGILESRLLSAETKHKFYTKVSEEELLVNSKILIQTAKIKALNDFFIISDNMLQAILKATFISPSDRIIIFNLNLSKLESQDIIEFLKTMPAPFNEILNKKKQALIESNVQNSILLQNLKTLGFINSYKNEKNGCRVFHKRKK
jgi:hypothetical protein